MHPKIAKITAREIDALALRAGRDPLAEAGVAWTSIWVFLVFSFAAVFGNWFVVNGIVLLERIAFILVIGGFVAFGLCWAFYRFQKSRVEMARKSLKTIRKSVVGGV